MKRYLRFIGGIVLLLLGAFMGTVGVVTLVRIMRNDMADRLDMILSVIMIVLIGTAICMIVMAGRLIHGRISDGQSVTVNQEDTIFQGDRQSKVWSIKVWKICLLILAVVCMSMRFVFLEQFVEMMAFVVAGSACMIVYGVLSGIEVARYGTWKSSNSRRNLEAAIGLPLFIYWIIIMILEYVAGVPSIFGG